MAVDLVIAVAFGVCVVWPLAGLVLALYLGPALGRAATHYPLADVADASTGAPLTLVGASTGSTGTPPPQGLDTHR